MVYHYESHTTTTQNGRTQTTSVSVRELDDGEVGILLSGNNSILDPSLTPRMLSVPTTDYDVESVAPLSPQMEEEEEDEEEEEEDWFPSLRHLSWIHGLDDDDDDEDALMMDRMMETLFASTVMEQEEDRSKKHWHKKSRREPRTRAHELGRQEEEEEEEEDSDLVELVPLDVIYLRF